jgi:hypothetical protein
MAKLIGSVQGSLSMFTGGETMVDEKQLKEISQSGSSYGVASYKDGLLNIAGIVAPPSAAASGASASAKSAG